MLQTSTGNLVNSVLKTDFFFFCLRLKTEFLKGEALYQEGIRGTGEGGRDTNSHPSQRKCG